MQLATHITASPATIWSHAALIRFGASREGSLEPEGESDMTNGDPTRKAYQRASISEAYFYPNS
jgi:hypothetical protein